MKLFQQKYQKCQLQACKHLHGISVILNPRIGLKFVRLFFFWRSGRPSDIIPARAMGREIETRRGMGW
jgi:hypothetical protein